MIAACRNPRVGYDNDHRTTFKSQVAKLSGGICIENLDSAKIDLCDCDCSSLVTLCFQCATGVDLGNDTYTSNLESKITATGLCTKIKDFSDNTKQFGEGLQVGDICLWRGPSGGHTAVVVNLNGDVSVSYNQDNISWISGITNVVIPDYETQYIYGQTKQQTIKNTKGVFRIYAKNKLGELKEINKVVAVGADRVPRYIYGFTKVPFSFSMIGDSRTVQLGSKLEGRNAADKNLLYGIIPDANIFAWWGCRLVELNSHFITRQQYTVSGVVTSADYNESNGLTAWFKNGTNDKAFYIENAKFSNGINSEQYERNASALVGKTLTFNGYAQVYDGAYSMSSFDEIFSPSSNYSYAEVSQIDGTIPSGSLSINEIIQIVNDKTKTYNKFNLTYQAKKLAKEAAQSELLSACFWFGINDIQIYKDAFLGRLAVNGQTTNQSRSMYIKSFVEEYNKLVSQYIFDSEFDNQSNNIYVTSIVSTSKLEKDYFEEQGQLVTDVNNLMSDWVDSIQTQWVHYNSGGTKKDCWLQYIELNIDSDGNIFPNAQDFVEDNDFVDNIHFTKRWFENWYLPRFDFSSFTGDVGELTEEDWSGGQEEEPFTGQPPADWPCDSRDINFYIREYPTRIYNWIRSRGYSSVFAIGIIANMGHESGFRPYIGGDYSAGQYEKSPGVYVSSRYRIYVGGYPATGDGWYDTSAYSDGKVYQSDGKCRWWRTFGPGATSASSFGFCQWHDTSWNFQTSQVPSDWRTNGIPRTQAQMSLGVPGGRGQNMKNYCLNLASHKATWSINPVGQLEYMMWELEHLFPSIWEKRYMTGNRDTAMKFAYDFCVIFESPPDKEVRGNQRATTAGNYWNALVGR